jgi:hypothetical protein
MFWAIEMNVENPERAMKTHARAVTKLDLSASDSNDILLSMPNGGSHQQGPLFGPHPVQSHVLLFILFLKLDINNQFVYITVYILLCLEVHHANCKNIH